MNDQEEKELRDIIQEAWNEGNSNPEDRFGDFLRRAARAIKEAGFVKLAKDQIPPSINETGDYMKDLVALHHSYYNDGWRKVEMGE